jgi:hypothetical protein
MLQKLFKGGNYSRAETICVNTVYENIYILQPRQRIVSAETICRNTVCMYLVTTDQESEVALKFVCTLLVFFIQYKI